MAGKKCVPLSPAGFTRYGRAALPGINPPPPSHVEPPSRDQTTYMSYSQDVSDCTVPAVDSAEQVAGLALRLIVKPKYGLPWLSVVNTTKGVDASWPTPPSKACWGVHVTPLSSEYDTHSVWKDCSMLTLQPVAFWARSAAIQA